MKSARWSWKIYLPILLALVIALNLAGDRFGNGPDKPSEGPSPNGSSHNHSHPGETQPPVPLEKAFGQAPDPKAVPPDPEREHRMAIYHYNEGNRFLKEGDWQEAASNYKMALHHDAALKEVYINMSTAYLKGRRFEDAQKTLAGLETLDPENPHLHYNRACLHSLTGDTRSALQSLKRAVAAGYPLPGGIETDPDLSALRQTEEFPQWIQTWNKNE